MLHIQRRCTSPVFLLCFIVLLISNDLTLKLPCLSRRLDEVTPGGPSQLKWLCGPVPALTTAGKPEQEAGGSVMNLTVAALVTHAQLIRAHGPHSVIRRKVRNLKLPLHQPYRNYIYRNVQKTIIFLQRL